MIPRCKDPAITFLKSVGYNVVQLPKADLRPTQLLVRNGRKLQRVGELASLFTADPAAPMPPVSPDNPGPPIAGTQSADIDLGVGLDILGGLIAALGGAKLGLTASYSRARSVQFEFSDTIENHAEMALLDQFLAGASISPLARSLREMLDADDVFIVTSTLKCRRINVVAKDATKAGVAIDVPVLQQAIGANIKVGSAGAGTSTIAYEGAIPLVFGLQAVRLIFDNGRYRRMKLVDAGSVGVESVMPAGPDDPVFLDADTMLGGDL